MTNGPGRTLSDLYVTCQLVADNKPLTIPFRTSFKAFKKDYTLVVIFVTNHLLLGTKIPLMQLHGTDGTSGSHFRFVTVISL